MDTLILPSAQIVTLSNGRCVANFASPGGFRFDDGSLLPACSYQRFLRVGVSRNRSEMHRELERITHDENIDAIVVSRQVVRFSALFNYLTQEEEQGIVRYCDPIPLAYSLRRFIVATQ